ncbi:MAG TPA: pentapeptide repeat-containing protein [Actinomycetes bacterium]|nr:pentapeptide repeat-containing protein [Actinomycetes bacterium]
MRPDDLRADCARCSALCCVAPAFARSADFAIDKPARQPCPNLQGDFRCGIHDRLRLEGFPGCAAYDCFGAGQKITQSTFAVQDWRRNPRLARQIFDAFAIMRGLHELLWYLSEALKLVTDREAGARLGRRRDEVERLSNLQAAELAEVDVPALRREIEPLLARVSELARAGVRRRPPGRRDDARRIVRRNLRGPDLDGADHRQADLTGAGLDRADLAGADLREADLAGADSAGARLREAELAGAGLDRADLAGADLRQADLAGAGLDRADLAGADLREADLAGANLRGALLIGANLSCANLQLADLGGADLRGTNVAGADLTGAIFLTQAQLDAAGGDRTTRLSASLRRPAHWPA